MSLQLSHTTETVSTLMLQVLMFNPTIAADGHTYDRDAIETWLQCNNTSPVTGDRLLHLHLMPNVVIKNLSAEACRQ